MKLIGLVQRATFFALATLPLLLPSPVLGQNQGLRLVPQVGHTMGLTSASFAPDGRTIATGSEDGMVRIWDVTSGKELQALRGNNLEVRFVAFSSDGKTIVTASRDKTVRIWDANHGTQIQQFNGHNDAVLCAAFSPDGTLLVTSSVDKTARLWDVATGKELRSVSSHSAPVLSAAFSPDSQMIVTASGQSAKVWDVATGRDVLTFNGHEDVVSSAAFSPDGRMVVTASGQTTRLWDVASGKELRSFIGHTFGVTSASFSPDGRTVVTSSQDRTIRLWSVASGEELRSFLGHSGSVTHALFSPDGRSIVSASLDETARVWDVVTARELQVLRGYTSVLICAYVSPDGKSIVTGSWDNLARVLDTTTGAQQQVLSGHQDFVFDASFSADGSRVLTASYDRTARLWNVRTGEMLRVFSGHRGRVMRATFSPNGETILTASEDGSARLWETATGKQLRVFSGHRGLLDSAFFSPDGKTIVTASWDGTAKIWNADSGDLIRTLRGHERALSSAVFSPDGNHIATAARDSTVRIWDVATGRVLRVLRGHASSVNGAFFSPDGKTIVTAAWDTTARIWEVTSGKELQILKGHQGVVSHASFSPDGKHVITTSADGSVRLWDVAAGKELYARYSFKDGSYIIIAPDGRYDSSEGANPKYGHFVIDTPAGPEAVGFDQIDPSEFYYKGLAEAIMTGKYEPGKRSLYAEKPFPSVEQKLDGTNLTFTATDQGGGIGDVWIVINQTRQRVIPKGSVRSGVPVTVDLKELGYKPGLTVDIQAHNATNGLRSPLQSSFALSRSGALEQPQATQKDPTPSRFIAVLIGSEAYSGSGDLRALNFPGDDAIELAKALHAMVTTGGVAKPEITVITDEPTAAERLKGLDGVKVVRGATKANWLNTLNQYQKSDFTANDWLFLAFAGHGVAYEKKYYYLTAESTSGTPSQGRESLWESTAISEDEIQAQLSKAVASNKNLVIDTCAAGVASGARNNQGQITATVTAFSYGNQGAHLLYATSDSREAFEALDLRHGYLTYSLLRVLKSGMDSRQGDRALVVMSKKWFDQAAELTAEVASQRGPQQKPALQASGDFSLGSLTDAQRLAIALPDLLPGIFASRITDSTGDQADWLNDGVMAAVKPGIRGMAFVRVEQEQGTNVFSLSGVLAEAGGKVTINLRLNQTTARGERLRSPAMVVTTTRANAVEDVLKAAAKLYEGRRDWPRG